jgi:hypothetical protein
MQPVLIVKAWQYEAKVAFPQFLGVGGSITAFGGGDSLAASDSPSGATGALELNALTQVLPLLVLFVAAVAVCCRQLVSALGASKRTSASYPRIAKASPRDSGNTGTGAPAPIAPSEATSLLEPSFEQSDSAACDDAYEPSSMAQPSKAQATELAAAPYEANSAFMPDELGAERAPSAALRPARVAQSPAAALRAEINAAFAPLPPHVQVGSSLYAFQNRQLENGNASGGSGGGSPGGGYGGYTSSLGPYGYVPPNMRSPQQTSPVGVVPKIRSSPSPPVAPSPPLDLRGLSRMEDFFADVGAGAPMATDQGSGRGLVDSARRFAKNITERVLPKKGFVKGVAERWTEAHLTPPPPPRTVSGFEPYSPEKLSISKLNLGDLDHSPERVGPSSFERRRRLIETQMLNA